MKEIFVRSDKDWVMLWWERKSLALPLTAYHAIVGVLASKVAADRWTRF